MSPRSIFWRSALAALLAAGMALPASAALDPAERAVLEELYTLTDGDNWTNNDRWMSATDPCESGSTWHGITCDSAGEHITRIGLENNNLSGSLSELSQLAALEQINVRENNLRGPLPTLPGSIRYFWAGENQLSGPIPDLSMFPGLESFDLYLNKVTGPLPALPASIRHFSVWGNKLSGSIPDLSGLTALQNYYVEGNNLTGAPASAPPASLTDAQVCVGGNFLELSSDPAINDGWQVATSRTPWNEHCRAPQFAPDLWRVTINVLGGNGSVWPPAPYIGIVDGVATSFRAIPNSGFVLDSIDGGACGGSQGGNIWTTDPITADCAVTVSFKAIAATTRAVTASVLGGNGTIDPSSQTVNNGDSALFNVSSDAGYEVDAFGGTCGPVTYFTPTQGYIAGPIDADCSVTVSFRLAGVATPIPTLAEWALILMGLLLAGMGAVHVQRRRS